MGNDVNSISQLKAILKRNFIIKRRDFKHTVQEIVMPVFFFGILLTIPNDISVYPATKNPPVFQFGKSPYPFTDYGKTIVYAPDNNSTRNIMNQVGSMLNLTLVPVSDETQIDSIYQGDINSFWAGVVFNSVLDTFNYTIKMEYDAIPDVNKKLVDAYECREDSKGQQSGCTSMLYYTSGFLYLQEAIDTAILNFRTGSFNATQTIFTQFMPKGEYKFTQTVASYIYPIYTVLAFTPFIQFLLIRLVTEKEKKLKQGMEIMGLQDHIYWGSWFITYAAEIVLFVIVCTFLGSMGTVWPNSNKVIIFIMLILFGLSLIGIGFIFSVFLNNARAAGGITTIVLLLLSAINLGLQRGASTTVCWVTAIFSPIAFTLGISEILLLEGTGTGVTFENINTIIGRFPVSGTLIMLAVDSAFYMLFAWYLQRVYPSEYGGRDAWYFIFRPLLKCFGVQKESEENLTLLGNYSETYEDVPRDWADKKVTFRLKSLTKVFDKSKPPAVDHLNLSVYEGEIFLLLGHNGAGKSTVINMSTGLIPPTSGTATICGYNLHTHMNEIRKNIGVCPQHDLLFDELTVREHLQFYGSVKDLKGAGLERQIDHLLQKIGLIQESNTLSTNLSGGMKRKLSLCIALIGSPPLLILDEPTSGMDPYSRRKVWELLNEFKKDRTIILTTHSMDEAEFLADRVAIVTAGRLKCLGSTLFLKNRFGVHYYLNVERHEHSDLNALNDVVAKMVKGSEQVQLTKTEVEYALPLKEVQSFPALFETIENESTKFNIGTFGVTLTTLEEVFLKLADDGIENPQEDEQGGVVVEVSEEEHAELLSTAPKQKIKSQVLAFALSRYRIFFRQPASVLCGLVIPIVLVIIGSLVAHLNGSVKKFEEQSLLISPSIYNVPKIALLNSTSHSLPSYFNDFPADVSYLTKSETSDFENYLFKHSPFLGGINIANWTNEQVYQYIVSYNDTMVHSLPILFNMIHNVQLKEATNQPSESITTIVSPIGASQNIFDASGIASVFLLGFSVIFTPIGFMAAVVQDGKLGYKRQLIVMGMKNISYWLACFLSDWLLYLTIAIAIFISVLSFDIGFSGAAFGPFAVIVLTTQLSLLLFSYLLTFFFKTPESVYRVATIIFQFAAMVPAIVVTILSSLDNSSRNISYIIHYVFSAIDPPYTLIGALNYIGLFQTIRAIELKKQPTTSDYFAEPTIYAPILGSIGQIIIFSLAVYYLDFIRYWNYGSSSNFVPEVNHDNTDSDVKNEIDEINKIRNSGRVDERDVVLVEHLGKTYRSTTGNGIFGSSNTTYKVAVTDLCLRVQLGECFGLLGPNGAGKSSTLAMLTGDTVPTFGTVKVGGFDVISQLAETYKLTGYCPQIDAFPPDLTARELLELFAIIKGYSEKDAKSLAVSIMKKLGIIKYKNQTTKGYSGGTKRKLSVGISLIVSPKVCYLDEASAGIDPASRHFLWEVIKSRMHTRTTILTTHSMEEAQALCNRVGIMVNGRLQCLGSTQHLKSKFGSGYNMEIKSDVDLTAIIKDAFPEAILEESLSGHYKYHIPKTDSPVSLIFKKIINITESYPVNDYAISQATLDQIFIKFAKKQEDQY